MASNDVPRDTELRAADDTRVPGMKAAIFRPDTGDTIRPHRPRWVEEVDVASHPEDLTVAFDDSRLDRPEGLDLPEAILRRWRAVQMRTAWARNNGARLTLTDRGVALARATVYRLSGVLDGQSVRICAIGDLACRADTTPAAAYSLFADLEADVHRRQDPDVVLLFCNDLHRWHHEGRYQDITPPDIQLTVQPTRRPGAPMLSIRTGEDADLPAIVAMDQTRAAPFRFHLDRSVDFVKHGIVRERLLAGLGPTGAQELQFFVTEEGTIATAFVVMRVHAGTWTLLQCGDRDPSGARVGAILQALIARDPSRTPPIVHGWLPTGFTPPQTTRVSDSRSSPRLWARFVAGSPPEWALSPEHTCYWLSDRF